MRFIPTLVLLLLAVSLRAKHVEPAEAKKVANSFLNSIGKTDHFLFPKIDIISAKPDQTSLIYIIHLKPSGFVMISADDRSYPVIAYSFESNYEVQGQPVNFKAWVDGYADQILYAISQDIRPDEKTVNAWNQYLTGTFIKSPSASVAPLLTSTWDQGYPYNYLCPEDAGGSGGYVWAGCVATAMAQVLYYWRYPLQGSYDHGYYSDYGYLYADFGNTQYRWEQMTNKAVTRNFEMAQLQSHLGISVDMMYGPGGSGAYSEDAANALINYFNMNPGLHLEYAPDPIDESWKSLLRSQLNAGYPLYYHGFGSGGHAFNVDGYENNNYFHFNWGWSGSYNGYFYLENLNPGGYNFTYGQGAIIDAYPAGNYPYYCNSTVTLTNLEGSIEDGSGPVSPYLGYANCGWLIAPEGDSVSEIRLTFHRFDLENNSDFVTIYDGSDASANVLGIFTGSTLPPIISSTGNRMFIKFTSNASGNAGGWLATYSAIKTVFCSGTTTLTAPEGSISDGSGPYNYRENTNCKFRIEPENATSISLTFTEFNTFDEGDFLAVFNLENNALLAKLFGQQNPGTLTFNTGQIQLIFHTNNTDNGQGWNLNYSATIHTETNKPLIDNGLVVSPNPASQLLRISFDNKESLYQSLRLISAEGSIVYQQNLPQVTSDDAIYIDVSRFAPGVYSLQLSAAQGVITRKVIIRR